MHVRIAVDSWVQPVTSVSIVFPLWYGQQAFQEGVMLSTPYNSPCPSLPDPINLPPLTFFFFFLQELAFDRHSAGRPNV